MKKNQLYYLLLLLMGLSLRGISQQPDSVSIFRHPVERQVHMLRNPWLVMQNPAGWQIHFQPAGNDLQLILNHYEGDFNPPQSPDENTTYGLSTSGFSQLNGNIVYGKFTYTRILEKDVEWNLINNPYNGSHMLVADSIGGNWKAYNYSLSTGIASRPIADWIVGGLTLNYSVNHAARDNDPRPETTGRDFAITPGLCLLLNRQNRIGIHFSFRSLKEELDVRNMSGIGSNMIYTMIGLREWEQPRMQTNLSMQSLRKVYETGAQYEQSKNNSIWLTNVAYSHRKDENKFDPYGFIVKEDELYSNSRPMGEFSQNQYKIVSLFNRQTLKGLHQAKLEGRRMEGRLWDALNENVSFLENEWDACLSYSFFRESFGQVPWEAGFKTQYSSTKREEFFYANEKIENLTVVLNGCKYFYSGEKTVWGLGVQLNSKINLNEYLIIEPKSSFLKAKTEVSENIIKPNHQYFSANYRQVQLISSCSFPANIGMNAFFKGVYSYTNSKNKGSRNRAEISLGLLF